MYPRARLSLFGSKEEFAAAALERYAAQKAEHSAAVLSDATTSPLKRLKRYFVDLAKISGQQGPIPGCLLDRFSLEIAAESPQMKKRISAPFARWQHAIAAVIERAVTQKNLPHTRVRSRWRVSVQQLGGGAIVFAS